MVSNTVSLCAQLKGLNYLGIIYTAEVYSGKKYINEAFSTVANTILKLRLIHFSNVKN
jgi:hypothetical protein